MHKKVLLLAVLLASGLAGALITVPASTQGQSGVYDSSGRLNVTGSGGTFPATQSGTWTVQPGNTANTTAWKVDGSAVTQPVSAASLPLPTGAATAAKQPALGTAGSSSTDVISVQGIASGTALPVSISNGSATSTVGGTSNVALVSFVAADPCMSNTKVFAGIGQTASATVITGTSSKKLYVCAINLVAADAENVAVVEGTGTVCATSMTTVPGLNAGTTAANGWNLAANGGLTYGSGIASIAATTVNADNLCVLQSGTGRVSGGIAYVVQ